MGKVYNLAVVPGDFIGKEVVEEEMKVLKIIAEQFGFAFKVTLYPHGGEYYIKTGELLSDSTLAELRGHDAIVFGAVGHPELQKGEVEKGILLKIRFGLDQYINLRPSKLYAGVDAPIRKIHPGLPDDYEITVVREGVGGLYKGIGSYDGVVARQEMNYTNAEVERILRYAYELARDKGQELILGFKSNVLEYVSAQQWQPMFEKMGKKIYPEVLAKYAHIDALNGPMLINSIPQESFVIVTGNMFGDVITDLTASLFGGMGVGASACINPYGTSMFEPIHGSSPKDYGKGTVSPVAAILSGVLMLKNLGEEKAAKKLELSVVNVLKQGKIPDFTINSGVPTKQQTQYIMEEIKKRTQ
ncbi:3-isopropylmalate dehydrogenase [Patescibacteria group bacterium]|nr:3-isopropylmalate dehydrogenase [Candidatus Falkowbacteria bacterium]MBU3906578.1 3-isopropylmalate dehydrogenase [Patescibacteria group bacterium]MBU4014613.1 3-isopropylmalate dehydrogenase [Patescibacteria group bacterium]MBU4026735.1 3-isopropylmalate dehydrogenase [Patescibacteria group bacterium]MBU4073053.1 3-isopropylmalate dehydrogenase [Patescibacteria group bacterium]